MYPARGGMDKLPASCFQLHGFPLRVGSGSSDARDHTEHVMQLNAIAGLEIPRDGLRADTSKAYLALRIVGVDEIDVERNLPVDADRLDARNEGRPRPLKHDTSV